MTKVQKLENALKLNQEEISKLEGFRQTKHVKQFLRQLFGEQSYIKTQIQKLQSSQERNQIPSQEKIKKANQNRSEKMKRSWRYFKVIQKNYDTKMSLRELRSAFSRHKRGLVTDVSDVIWRNPSP